MKYAFLNGQKVYKVQETASEYAVSCMDEVEVGWLYKNGEFLPPPGTLKFEKQKKLQEINNIRSYKLAQPVLYNSNPYDSDQKSIQNLTNTIAAYSSQPLPNNYTWRTADNQNIVVTLEDLKAILLKIMEQVNLIYNTSWEKKQQVEQSTTIQAVQSIVW